jgi:hypothetical protein
VGAGPLAADGAAAPRASAAARAGWARAAVASSATTTSAAAVLVTAIHLGRAVREVATDPALTVSCSAMDRLHPWNRVVSRSERPSF